jgi:hypothetical protein
MNKIPSIALLVVVFLTTALVGTSQGQYYGYWYGAPGYPVPAPQQAPAPNALYYRLAPNPLLFRQWDNQIRIWDFQELQRSPLNPESPLDYLMRTF